MPSGERPGPDRPGPSSSGQDPRGALERVRRDAEILGTSSLVRGAALPDDDADDPAVRWGKRVGRALSVLLFIVLAFWLGAQLGWWRLP